MNSFYLHQCKLKLEIRVFIFYFQSLRQPDSNRIISVYRTRLDACNRLWFVDTGLLEYPSNTISLIKKKQEFKKKTQEYPHDMRFTILMILNR